MPSDPQKCKQPPLPFFCFPAATQGQRRRQQEAAVLARRSAIVSHLEGKAEAIVAALESAAGRLLKAFAIQVELLRRLRHGAGLYVRVEHVHIHVGGQAVIGNVRARDGDGGGPSTK